MILLRIMAIVSRDDLRIPQPELTQATFTSILQTVFAVAGGVALVAITVAGLKYVLSQGNPQETAKAKNAILYALLGMGVSIFAYSIVTFVIARA